MSRRTRVGIGVLVALVMALPVVAAWLVQRRVPVAHAAGAPWFALAVDSAGADSAAYDALPPALASLFAVRAAIGTAVPESLPLYECLALPGRAPAELRRRLQLRLPDSSAAVVYVVADSLTGGLERVEFLRRVPGTGQRGFIWDRRRDRTVSVWWFEGTRGRLRREERGDLPRGGPVPRAVRGLGRQLLRVPCAGAPENSPMNPISGSRN